MGDEARTPPPPPPPAAAAGHAIARSPTEKPPFTLRDLKQSIPPHCFRRSLLRSFSFLLRDLALAAALLFSALAAIPSLPPPLRPAGWLAYWICQGCVLTGVWVIAHECGHHAFSDYPLLDDLLGLILHSSLLVPYFSWKISHRRHHSNTGSMERDEVFVPSLKDDVVWFAPFLAKNPAGRAIGICVQLILGWPLYLAMNLSGRPYRRFASHFDPYSPIYNARERALILVSDAGVMAAGCLLYKLAASYGFLWVVKVYGVPLLVVNAWLVLITFLQHTHTALPHYGSEEWDWLRGALATADRDYGVLNRVFHNITDTHVVHHLFSTMPHYHAEEATRAVRPVLGEYYRFDDTPIFKALWREANECVYVEPEKASGGGNVFWYNNKF